MLHSISMPTLPYDRIFFKVVVGRSVYRAATYHIADYDET